MTEEQIAELQLRLEHLEAQNKEYETALNGLRPLLAQRTSHAERQRLLQGVAQNTSPFQTQIWRFVLGEAETLKQGHLALRR